MVVWSTDTPRSRSISSRSRYEIAVRDRELQVSAHRPQDHVRRELPALERTLPPCHPRYAPADSNPPLLPDQTSAANLATEPSIQLRYGVVSSLRAFSSR